METFFFLLVPSCSVMEIFFSSGSELLGYGILFFSSGSELLGYGNLFFCSGSELLGYGIDENTLA